MSADYEGALLQLTITGGTSPVRRCPSTDDDDGGDVDDDTLHGRQVYKHETRNQSIFYIYGEYDGWMLGPRPDENFGGLKNSHDGMCVHNSVETAARGWGY